MSSGLTADVARDLLESGMSQTEVSRIYGVSRQYVHILAKRAGYEPSKRLNLDGLMPWDVDYSGHWPNHIFRGMRAHLKTILLPHEGEGDADKKARESMFRKLVRYNQVIDFDPSHPAVKGLSNTGGFKYVPRTAEDKDYIVKVKPGVKVNNTFKKLWTMPKDLPE